MRRADVPIRVRERIVHVKGDAYMASVVAIRAPDQDWPEALLNAPHRLAYTLLSIMQNLKITWGRSPNPPGGYAAEGRL